MNVLLCKFIGEAYIQQASKQKKKSKKNEHGQEDGRISLAREKNPPGAGHLDFTATKHQQSPPYAEQKTQTCSTRPATEERIGRLKKLSRIWGKVLKILSVRHPLGKTSFATEMSPFLPLLSLCPTRMRHVFSVGVSLHRNLEVSEAHG